MGFFGGIAGRVRSLLSFDKEKITLQLAKGGTSSSAPQSGFDLLQAYGYDLLSDYLRLEQDLMSRYVDMEEMDEAPELSCITKECSILTPKSPEMSSGEDGKYATGSYGRTVEELIKENGGEPKDLLVFALDHENKRVVVAKAKGPVKTGTKPVYRITFEELRRDHEWSIKTTGDHLFMMRDGEYIRADRLQAGDRLMPCTLRLSPTGYLTVYEPLKQTKSNNPVYKNVHTLVGEAIAGRPLIEDEVVHHHDRNKTNPDPSNFEVTTRADHVREHNGNHEEGFEKKYGQPDQGKISTSHRAAISKARRIPLSRDVVEAAMRASSSLSEASQKLNVSWNTIVRRINDAGIDKSILGSNLDGPRPGDTAYSNHRVVSVEYIGEEDVYDIEVPKYHNFAVGDQSNGGGFVFVHNSALDIYADDSTQTDSIQNKSVWVDSTDKTVQEIGNDLFHRRLRIDEEIWSMSRSLAKYGNDYSELLVANDGVVGLNVLPAPTMRRIEGRRGELFGFIQDFRGRFGYSPDEFKQLLAQRTAYGQNGQGWEKMAVLEDWEVVHMRLRAKHRRSVYGIGVLDGARWIWKRLMLLEDAAMIYRLCLRGDSNIWTTNGYKKIKDIKEGDYVYSYSPDGNLKRTKVVYSKNNGPDKIYKVHSFHHDLYANATHPVLVEYWTCPGSGRGHRKVKIQEYVEVQNLVPGLHRFVMPHRKSGEEIFLKFPEAERRARIKEGKTVDRTFSYLRTAQEHRVHHYRARAFFESGGSLLENRAIDLLAVNGYENHQDLLDSWEDWGGAKNPNLPKTVTKEFARWFGFMIGDGFVCERGSVGFSAGDDQVTNQRYKRLFESFVGPVRFDEDRRSSKGTGAYVVGSVTLAEFMKLNGFIPGAHNKRIPEWVFRAAPEIGREFLEGLIDADGHWKEQSVSKVYKRIRYRRATVEMCNRDLVEDIRQLALQAGLSTGRVLEGKTKGGRKINGVALPETSSYSVDIRFCPPETSEYILSVTEAGQEDVFDIGVEAEEHNFVSDGVVVHNTRSPERFAFYIDVGDLPPKEAFAYLNKVRQQYKKTKFYNPSCLTADTCITCLDGVDRSIGELAQTHADEPFWVFSYDLENGRVVPGKASKPRKTGEQVPIWRVVLDNGAVVRCTGNHPFLMRDGTYKAANTLASGDSLMPLYLSRGSKGTQGYWTFTEPSTGTRSYVHQMVAKSIFGDGYAVGGYHAHHLDGNKANNCPDNLERMTAREHMLVHPDHAAKGRQYFANRIRKDRAFALEIAERLASWRREDPERARQAASEHGRRAMAKRKQLAAEGQRFLLEVIASEVVRDPLVVASELVDRLNANEEFSAVYLALPTTVKDTITVGCLHAFLKRNGFAGFKAFKKEKTGQVRWKNRTYGGIPTRGRNVLNHKVVSVTFVGYEDVYNLDVEKYHNFGLTSGVFVHNTGRLDLKFNPLAADEDFFLPIRKGVQGTRIDVLGSPSWQCLTADTRVPLLDGTCPTIKELSDRGGDFWVYSVDKDGRITAGHAWNAHMTREAAEIWEVELDNGEVVSCTDNHNFLTRDGKWVQAKDLTPGQSLMPLYRRATPWPQKRVLAGYEEVYDPASGKYVYIHHRVYEDIVGSVKEAWANGLHLHHVNHNKLDNRPENIKAVGHEEHRLEHTEERIARNIERMKDPRNRAKAAATIANWNRSQGHKDRVTGRYHHKWVEINVAGLVRLIRKSGAKTMRELIDRKIISQNTIQKVLRQSGMTWTEFALKHIPGWEPKGRAKCKTKKPAYKNPRIYAQEHRDKKAASNAASRQVDEDASIACRSLADDNGGDQPATQHNHKVVSVRKTERVEPVYCLTVDVHHNFATKNCIVANSMSDIEYFRLKLFAAIKVPKTYLGYDQTTGKGTLSAEDVRFSRSVLRLQRELRNGLAKVMRVHLAALNINPGAVDYNIYMTVPSSIFELAQLEVRNAKADFAGRMSQFVSLHWILQKIFGLSDHEIEYVVKQRHDEMLEDAEIQAKAGGMQMQAQAQAQQAAAGPAALHQAMTAEPGSKQAEEARAAIREFGSLSHTWPLKRQLAGYRPITEKDLLQGNRDHEKRMEDNLEKILKENSGMSNRLGELGGLINELRMAIPRGKKPSDS